MPEPRRMRGTVENSAYADRIATGTVGLRIPVTRFVAKNKMSQNQAGRDRRPHHRRARGRRSLREPRARRRDAPHPRGAARAAARRERHRRRRPPAHGCREPLLLAGARLPGPTSPSTCTRERTRRGDRAGRCDPSDRRAPRRPRRRIPRAGLWRPARALLAVGDGVAPHSTSPARTRPPRPRRSSRPPSTAASREVIGFGYPRRALARCADSGDPRRASRATCPSCSSRPTCTRCWLNSAALAPARRGRRRRTSGVLREDDRLRPRRATRRRGRRRCSTPGSPRRPSAAAARGVVGIIDLEMRWNRDDWVRRVAGGIRALRVVVRRLHRSTSNARSARGCAPATPCRAPADS